MNYYKKNLPKNEIKNDTPITSYGIILVKLLSNDFKHTNINFKYEKMDGIKLLNENDLFNVADAMDKIHFLLVQRRHSLGFAEFILAHYSISNISGIRSLFNQMVPEEIEFIKNSNDFDELWNFFWGYHNNVVIPKKKNYFDSKEKFIKLKSKINIESDLDFYVNTAIPNYLNNEWRMPCGRSQLFENNLQTAIREFCEETNFNLSDIQILENIKPIHENLIGTNGIHYRHIYYLAECITDKQPLIDTNNSEIKDIRFVTYNESLSLLRDYHVEKKEILQSILNYYIEVSRHNAKTKIN